MKFFKLSLAVALAVFSLFCLSAAPLEDAIKDMDVSGFGNYRFESFDSKYGTNSANDTQKNPVNKEHSIAQRFTLDINFKATLDDNFFAVIGLRYDSQDIAGSHASKNSGLANTHGGLSGVNGGWGGDGGDSFSLRQYYVGFRGIPYTTVLFGRQRANSFFADDIAATGLKVEVNPAEGLMLAGVFYTNFENDSDLGGVPFDPMILNEQVVNQGAYIHQKNLWGLAAVYQNEMLDLEAWYAGLNKVANLLALSAGASYDINDYVAFYTKAQWSYANLASKFKDNWRVGEDGNSDPKGQSIAADSNFIGFELGASFYSFEIDAGYLQYGKKDKSSIHSIEYQGGFISAGEELLNYRNFSGKHKVWFVKAKYTYDAYSLGLDYVYDKIKGSDKFGKNAKANELVIRAGYKYNDKLIFNAWYSMISEKYDSSLNKGKDKVNHFRLDARYSF